MVFIPLQCTSDCTLLQAIQTVCVDWQQLLPTSSCLVVMMRLYAIGMPQWEHVFQLSMVIQTISIGKCVEFTRITLLKTCYYFFSKKHTKCLCCEH
jgi:hypothetical protein